MKHLRKAIRTILLENNRQIEKIANLLLSGDSESAGQGIELAIAFGYLEVTNKKTHGPPPFRPSEGSYIEWDITATPELEEVLLDFEEQGNHKGEARSKGLGKGGFWIYASVIQ